MTLREHRRRLLAAAALAAGLASLPAAAQDTPAADTPAADTTDAGTPAAEAPDAAGQDMAGQGTVGQDTAPAATEAAPAQTAPEAAPAATADAAPADAAATDANPVVATVNGDEIRRDEVLAALDRLPPQLQGMPPEMLIPVVADQLATGRLLAERAYAEGLQDDPVARARIADVERAIIADLWLQRAIDARMTDAAVDEAYQAFLAQNPPTEEVRARHILVDSQDKAQSIIDQLDQGADFAELAAANSSDPGSAQSGGDLGYFHHDDMVEPFADAAFDLQPGEYTEEPVESQFGWHVIQVEDRRTPEPPTEDEVRDQLTSQLAQQYVQGIIEEVRQGADVTIFGPDGRPLPGPGDTSPE